MSTAIGASMASTSSATAPRSASAAASAACSSPGRDHRDGAAQRRRPARAAAAADADELVGADGLTTSGCAPVLRTGPGRLDPGRGRGQQPVGDLHDLGRRAVVHRERHAAAAARGTGSSATTSSQFAERAGTARLPEVADERHRPGRAPAGQHPPLHRGEVLRLVDEHVAERARLVVVWPTAATVAAVAVDQLSAAVGEAADAELVDRAARLLELLVAVATSPARRGRAADTGPEQRVGLVDQREVGVGPRRRRATSARALAESRRCSLGEQHAGRPRSARAPRTRTGRGPARCR